jgi:hypothetical protein
MSLRPGLGEPKNPGPRQHAKERRAKVDNRPERRQVLADEQWDRVQARDARIEMMPSSTEEILRLARSTHELTPSHTGTSGGP